MESWVHVSPLEGTGNGEVQITVDTNNSSEDRITTVNVETSTLNKILTIIQKGKLDMTFKFLFFKKDAAGTITASLDGTPKSAGEMTSLFPSILGEPLIIMYQKMGLGNMLHFLFADDVSMNPGTSRFMITFSTDTKIIVATTGFTES